jgi:hypothetical protein
MIILINATVISKEYKGILKTIISRRTNRLFSFDTARSALKTTRPTILLLRVYSLPR